MPVTYTSTGPEFAYDSARWKDVDWYVEYYMRADSGTFYARLYDVTAAAAVTGSDASTTSTTPVRIRVGPVTLTNGNSYRVQRGVDTALGDAGELINARLVALRKP